MAAGVWGTDFDYRRVGQEFIDWARDHGLWVIGWPCDSAEDLARLRAYGVDAVGSNLPSSIEELLASG